ncbi:mitochondrial ribonuclease P protein 1 homolog isoform X1 [Galleria mellonella]|uniref:RNA (guanine-9-)-methyltransferase domain-containing protein 1 n=2 Tax=Galleria mellonella TaxID=7137 RepID=A0A6J1X0K9_GALME|nr:mitochondrial ribonuclease P protein 1 homolog isoform X1 [Galleria mellonella]
MYCIRSIFTLIKRHQPITAIPKINILKTSFKSELSRFYSKVIEDESDNIINELCNGDPEQEKKLRILMLEVEVMRQDGRCAPNILLSKHWQHLMQLETRNQRTKYLLYLWKTEKSKENQKAKKEARRKQLEEMPPEANKEYPDDITYGISERSLFLRIRDQSINNFDNYRNLQAIIHGLPIVIDCSYEDYMVYREAVNAAKQMTFLFGDNRIHRDPFNIHLCNVNTEGSFMKQLEKNIPSLKESWFPLNIHTKSYLDIFPKERLVYLTPHCREELTKFDYDAVYIVGCMVDKVNNEPLSLAKAKRDGIKMAKLPLDRYLEWAPGSKKNLNINHMIPILLDLKSTGDWEFSLRHIPRRKLMETKILAMQKALKNTQLSKDEVFNNFKKYSNLKGISSFKNRRSSSRKSLYDDD